MLDSAEGRDLSVLVVIGSLFSKGEEPPYNQYQISKEAVELGIPVRLGMHVLRGLSKKGYIRLVKKSGYLYVYPTSHALLDLPRGETLFLDYTYSDSGGIGMGKVTSKALSVLEIVDAIYSEGKERPPYSVDLIRRRSREIKRRFGPLSWLVGDLVRLSKEGRIRLVTRSGELYVYPAAYSSSLLSGEEPYKLDLRKKKKGKVEVIGLLPRHIGHLVLDHLSSVPEGSSLRDTRKSAGFLDDVVLNRLEAAGLIERSSKRSEIWLRLTDAGRKARKVLESGKRAGFTEAEVDPELWSVCKEDLYLSGL